MSQVAALVTTTQYWAWVNDLALATRINRQACALATHVADIAKSPSSYHPVSPLAIEVIWGNESMDGRFSLSASPFHNSINTNK